MQEITLTATVDASPDTVFDIFTDHWAEIWGNNQRRIRDGRDPSTLNGLGSVRAIRLAPGLELHEELVVHDRPVRIAYIAHRGAVIADHYATLELRPMEGGTEVDYRISMQTRAWVPGRIVAAVLRRVWRRHSVPVLDRLAVEAC